MNQREIYCPYCGTLIMEDVSQETYESEEAYAEIIADHCATHLSCERKRRERRERRWSGLF